MGKNNLELIRQALASAEGSIKLAKQLLGEVEGAGIEAKPKAQDLPGISGIFDGENMVSSEGQSFPVPANYASKSLLVVGDTLKLVDEGKEKRFKQIEHVKRHKTNGILTKKDGKWKVVTPEGSYKVLPAAVAHFGAEIGSEIVLQLPANNLTVPYGAIEAVKKPQASAPEPKDNQPHSADDTKEAPKPVEKSSPKEVAKNDPKPINEPVKPKPEVKPVVKDTTIKKEEQPKPAEAKPEPKIAESVKETPKETVVIKPEPLKAITVEPEPKVVEQEIATPPVKTTSSPVPAVSATTSSPKSAPIEISPEEDELT